MRKFDSWQEDLEFDRIVGSPNAPYRMVVWTDYQCPACKQLESEIDSVRLELGDSLAVIYRYFPLGNHPLAFPASVAAECARAQGKFGPMHRTLFRSSLGVGPQGVLPDSALARASGVPNLDAFTECISDSAVEEVVRRDMSRGRQLGLRGTPSIQVGQRLGTGSRLAEELIPMLRAARRDVNR